MKLSPDEAANVVYNGSDDWEPVNGTEEITENSRWSIHKKGVFKHTPSGKYYLFRWSQGATESQNESAYEFDEDDIEPVEVSLQEVTREEWLPVEK